MRRSAILLVVVMVALGLAAGCSSKAQRDQQIATEIKAKMFSDAQLKSANLDVAAKNGEVTLTGEVPSDAARYQAFKLASDIPGVNKVNDHLTVPVAAAPALPAPTPDPAPAPVARHRSIKHSAPAPAPQHEDAAAPVAAPAPTVAAAPAPVTPQPRQVEIPARTNISIRMIDSVDSEVNHTGEIFRASLDAPIVADNEVVVPAGTDVFVKLATARSAGHIAGQSELGLELVRMEFQGKSYTLVSNEYEQKGASRGKRTAATVGGGAVLGALIGAVAGGGKGAAIGAGVGAGTGTVVQAVTKGQQVKIPSETKLDFRLEQPVEVSYFPEKNRSRR